MAPADRPRSFVVPWEELPAHIRALVPRPAPPDAAPATRPGLLEKAGDLIAATVDHVRDGGRIADDETRAARKAACLACPHHDPARDGCTRCACGMNPLLSFVGLDLDLKRSWASSACPDSPPRWDTV